MISIDDISIRTELRPGDFGAVVQMHGSLYKQEFDYGIEFEIIVAKGLLEFYELHTPEKSCVWIGEYRNEIVGFVLLLERGTAAQLRFFIVSPGFRNIGLGKKLMQLFLGFLKSAGYKSGYLWTTNEQTTAAKLYSKFGFTLTQELQSNRFGKPLKEQRWELNV